MQSLLSKLTLFVLIFGITSSASALERKPEWAQYSRSKPTAAEQKGMQLKLSSEKDQISYSIGMNIAEGIKAQGIEINPEVLARGITDMLNGTELALTKADAVKVLTKLQEQLSKKQEGLAAKQREEMALVAEKNLQAGKAYLAENAKNPDVTVTESGLQYEVLTPGTGATPKSEDIVVVDYRGSFIDGQEFDSSYSRGEPVEFSVNAIIPGWTEALLMMKEGGKWKITLPATLAYGAQGAPPLIEPNTTLVFEVELKSIQE
jgi:FKBP-type peptidyl-prolyl cis-trans isomerase